MAELTSQGTKVSSHYLIDESGEIIQLVDERRRAWHAGASKWGNFSDVNSISIGIELVNASGMVFPQAQINSLIELLEDIRQRRGLSARNVVGHSDVALGRKMDPGPLFPWSRLAEKGFGLWCPFRPAPPPPARFDDMLALQALGYDVHQYQKAVAAFKLHYLSNQPDALPDEIYRAQVNCIVNQARNTE